MTRKREKYVPKRGDFVYLDFEPQAGSEQKGRRPALVLSVANYNNKSGLFIVCPTTTQVKDYPFEVEIPEGSQISGVVISDQIRSLDWRARNAEFAGSSTKELLVEVLAKVNTLFRD